MLDFVPLRTKSLEAFPAMTSGTLMGYTKSLHNPCKFIGRISISFTRPRRINVYKILSKALTLRCGIFVPWDIKRHHIFLSSSHVYHPFQGYLPDVVKDYKAFHITSYKSCEHPLQLGIYKLVIRRWFHRCEIIFSLPYTCNYNHS